VNSRQTELAIDIAKAHQSGRAKPNADADLTLAEAYEVQGSVVTHLGGSVVGFKSALSSAAAQAAFSMTEPVFGALLSQAEVGSGFALAEMATPMIEIEMGFQLGATLTSTLSPEDFNQVFMSTVMAIDLADVGFSSRPAGMDLVTSNAAGGRFLRGDAIHCNDPNTVAAELKFNGEVINAAVSGDIGDQRALAVWLVNKALALGYEVSSGMLVMTGAMGQILPAKPGHYEACYGDLGRFSFELV
jgi:2-keto-4-pentenoate hydratase